jgi:hypothetical protein
MKGRIFDCGCVEGHYWCNKHDIYTKQDKKDMPPHGDPRPGERISKVVGYTEHDVHIFSQPGQEVKRELRHSEKPEFYNIGDAWDAEKSCTCFQNPPCSYCTSQSEEDDEPTE